MSGRPGEAAVLVVGGSGAFGSRLVAGIVATTTLSVVIAGRDLGRAEATARVHPAGRVRAVRLDAAAVTSDDLIALGLRLVVDAAGPFQGTEPCMARAAIAAGLPYLDLADARDFVAGFATLLDADARTAGIVALTGASSTPALSNAVLDAITDGWRRVEAVSVAIVPGNRAPRGLSVMRAILSYVGRPMRLFRDGAWEMRPGWGSLTRVGVPGLGRRWASLCETPDLDIMPARLPQVRSVVFRAGLELPFLHLGLWLASWPVRLQLLPSLVPFAKPFLMVAGWLDRFGSDRGGMIVEALGRDGENRPTRALWSLVAEAGDGPYVPTLPALAMIRRLTDPSAEPVAPGARPCVGMLPLASIASEMARLRITTRIERSHPQPLFARALGAGFDAVPAPIRDLHGATGGLTYSGAAEVERGPGFAVAFVAALFRLPRPMAAGPVRVAIRPEGGTERWTRGFADTRFSSVMGLAPGGEGRGLLRERFGPFAMDLAVTAHAEGLDMTVTGWRLGPLPLPRSLRPTTQASERLDAQGRFRFDVALFLPRVGLLVRYKGWLVPEPVENRR
ncbi:MULTISPECIES: SDR family oxidoreductase [Methylobacterium]|uniref:Saccharopine dehydrogenase n=1 Tax=Methylobacterium thuringiense TaxID=1003091 RepID=A0ABQ4TS27_9HYPH|nr:MULTISPECIES: SDR family oxidoreductase [Methylobacterium]GJE56655.1 hypothetical protein EKPJFOCH_3163 [Methylobacterium thuringiense]